MRFFREMWIGDSVVHERSMLYRQALEAELSGSVYMLALSESGTYPIDIYPGTVLATPYYKKSEQLVIGLAGSYDEALELAGGIINMVYNVRKDTDITSYFAPVVKEGLYD